MQGKMGANLRGAGALAGARTPEELETLLEDSCLIHDCEALARLFEDRAVMAADDGRAVRGGDAIACLMAERAKGNQTYLADPLRVVQAGEIALIVGERSINVARRDSDGDWRYIIALPFLRERSDAADYEGGTAMQDTNRAQTLALKAVRAGAGEARWWLGMLAEIKATAADTDGRFTIVEITCPPGYAAPLHVHHRADEAFWVLDGDVTLQVGDATIEAHAGDYAFGPRDIPHRYTVGNAGCRMLFIVTPGGFEDLVIAMSAPAGSRTLPPPPDQERDWEQIAAIAAAHGCTLLA